MGKEKSHDFKSKKQSDKNKSKKTLYDPFTELDAKVLHFFVHWDKDKVMRNIITRRPGLVQALEVAIANVLSGRDAIHEVWVRMPD